MAHPSSSVAPSSQSSVVAASLQLLSQVMSLTLGGHNRWREAVDASLEDSKARAANYQTILNQLFAAPPPLMTPQQQLFAEQVTSNLERSKRWVQYVQDTEKTREDLGALIEQAMTNRAPMLVLRALIVSVDYCASSLFGEESEHDDVKRVRVWMHQADALLQAFVESLTPEQVREIGPEAADFVSMLACLGALHLVPVLQRMADCECRPMQYGVNYLCQLSAQPDLHFIDVTPIFALFARGLDPTIVDPKVKPARGNEAQPARSPIEAARAFTVDNPADAADDESHVQTSFVNLIPAYIAQVALPADEEEQRQATLHRNFLRAMIPAWKAHSNVVRSMLFEAAPDRLIPPLVEICAAYLDFERS